MISLIGKTRPTINENSILSGRLLSWWEAYGTTALARFYSDRQGGYAAILDGQAVVICTTASSREEFGAFIELQPDIHTIYTDVSTAESWGLPFRPLPVMRCEQVVSAKPLTEPSSPREIYDVLTAVFDDFPAFEPWYMDVSYRMRHELCHHASVYQENTLISTAMTVAEWQSGALLGAVATLPEHRRKGYAATCVCALTAWCQQRGKKAYISPKNENAWRLYTDLGFRDYETVAVIERM